MKLQKITIASFCVLSLGIASLKAQECSLFFPSKEGSMVEQTQYDAKNKVIGITRQTVLSKESTGLGVKINFQSESFSPKNESQNKGNYTVKCEKGIFYFDMNNFIPPGQGSNKDMEMEIKSDNLEFPSKLLFRLLLGILVPGLLHEKILN